MGCVSAVTWYSSAPYPTCVTLGGGLFSEPVWPAELRAPILGCLRVRLRLAPPPVDLLPPEVCSLLNPAAIYANNEISLRDVEVYGFDYDYTLAQYSDTLHPEIFNAARDILVEHYKVRPDQPLVGGWLNGSRGNCPASRCANAAGSGLASFPPTVPGGHSEV